MEDSNYKYFQFAKEYDYPIYIKYCLSEFSPELSSFLIRNRFTELSDADSVEIQNNIGSVKYMRILELSEATNQIMREIERFGENDKFGDESIWPKEGHKMYKFRDTALMIYSFMAPEWQLAVSCDFGSEKENHKDKVVINRFLSWALAPFGIVGFWGVPVDEGVVVMRQNKSIGEAFFIDIQNRNVITLDGIRKLSSKFKILRLKSLLRGKNVRMSKEEYLSFLTIHCTYFDFEGLSIPVRQVIQRIVKITDGLLHPEDSFRPRTDLSL